jgi:hypothetical protein
MAEVLGDHEPSEKEIEEIGREMDERSERLKRVPVAAVSMDYAVAARRWFAEHKGIDDDSDPAVRDAIETIGRDCFLIHVKIMRALNGRDESRGGRGFEKRAVQSDWNGSAKVALMSIQRSEPAWRIVAASTKDEAATVLAGSLAHLHQEMNREFPRAMAFRRPGFDDGDMPS